MLTELGSHFKNILWTDLHPLCELAAYDWYSHCDGGLFKRT